MELPGFFNGEAPKPFSSAHEELSFLREQVAQKERELAARGEIPDRETLVGEKVAEYKKTEPEKVLASEHRMEEKHADAIVLKLAPEEHDATMSELLGVLREKGIRNALSVVEKMNNPHVADDFHRILVQYVAEGLPLTGLPEGGPLFKALHMSLYEISLPARGKDEPEKGLKELVSSMEQFYAGMLGGTGKKEKRDYFTLEIALPSVGGEVSFFAAVPDHKKDLFEKQLLSVFSGAKVEERRDDYNIFSEKGASGAVATLAQPPVFPLKTYEQFDYDPLNVIVNAFSKLKEHGEGAALQLVVNPVGDRYVTKYRGVLDTLQKGEPTKKAIRSGLEGFLGEVKDVFWGGSSKKKDASAPVLDQIAIDALKQKIASPIVEANIRIVTAAASVARAEEILSDIIAAFNQFENTGVNALRFDRVKGGAKAAQIFHDFSFREFSSSQSLPLNVRELTSMVHFPAAGITSSPYVKHAKSATAPAPLEMAKEGVVLGVNRYRGEETKVVMGREDRLRHFYTIGQTGTGKSTLLKNMIVQDIARGEGVCMIDPHGNDIVDVLGMIPPERFKDVIYFDPSYALRPVALNMLEYDTRYPEQKTFVVNELFSIFKKLYGAVPESMGPAFEQYFRNATLLVIEDPGSGNTLLDVSRVLSDKRFRDMKLSHCGNPVVVQFWREIAEKAGGESSLANIVPYITNKFDVFLANEIMRPIVAQEKSAFNFRSIMDERKILLVNLSKGRLGDINANLIGLIVVGKILMAALSRADSFGVPVAPFYLYIDEFQNITTDSIATILSEARKYGLALTIAHQFIGQISDETRNAVFGNVGSLCAFRVGAEDAGVMEKQFEPVFSAADLVNLDNRNAYLKLLIDGKPAKAFNFETLPPQPINPAQIDTLKELSYRVFGRDRSEVERAISEKYAKTPVVQGAGIV